MTPSAQDVDRTALGPCSRLNDGGQGTVYRLDKRPDVLFKEYHPHIAADGVELGRLIAKPAVMTESDRRFVMEHTAWPLSRVMDGGRCVGFLMQMAPERFMAEVSTRRLPLELQFLLFPAKPMWKNLAQPSIAERRELVAQYVRLFQVLHRYDVIVGDVSMKNFLWTIKQQLGIFALDCDGFRINGHHPVTPQPQTPNWEDPTLPAGRATLDSDRYKLSLLVTRVLLAEPYLAPEEILQRPEMRERLGDALTRVLESAAGLDFRPHPDLWLRAIEGRPTLTLTPPPRMPSSPPPPSAPKIMPRPSVRLSPPPPTAGTERGTPVSHRQRTQRAVIRLDPLYARKPPHDPGSASPSQTGGG